MRSGLHERLAPRYPVLAGAGDIGAAPLVRDQRLFLYVNPLVSELSVAEPLRELAAIASAVSCCFQHLALDLIGLLRDLIVRQYAASW